MTSSSTFLLQALSLSLFGWSCSVSPALKMSRRCLSSEYLAGIVSPLAFVAMVLMALFTTALAMPLARVALGRTNRGNLVMQPLTAPGQQV